MLILFLTFLFKLIHFLLEIIILFVKLVWIGEFLVVSTWEIQKNLREGQRKEFLDVFMLKKRFIVLLLLSMLEEFPPLDPILSIVLVAEFINWFCNQFLDCTELFKQDSPIFTSDNSSNLYHQSFKAFFIFLIKYRVHLILGLLLPSGIRYSKLCVWFEDWPNLGVVFQIVELHLSLNVDGFQPVFYENGVFNLSLHCYQVCIK